MLTALCLAAVVLMPGVVMAGDDGVFSSEESLTYRVAYGPAHLADMDVDVGCAADGVVEARLVAESQGMADRAHPFRVRLDTKTDMNGTDVGWAQTWIREKGSVRRFRSRFDATPRVATEAVVGSEESREIVDLPDRGHDLLSWIMHLRGDIAAQGRQLESRRYALWDGWKLVWLDVIPGDVKTRETPLGQLRAQEFALKRTRLHHDGDRRFQSRADTEDLGSIWIEVSSRALPLAMAFRAPIGRVRIELASYGSDDC